MSVEMVSALSNTNSIFKHMRTSKNVPTSPAHSSMLNLSYPPAEPTLNTAKSLRSGSGWIRGNALTGRTWNWMSCGRRASATACGIRSVFCVTAQWCPAVWTMRGISLWEIFFGRNCRRSWIAQEPAPSTRASPAEKWWNRSASAADMPQDFKNKRRKSRLPSFFVYQRPRKRPIRSKKLLTDSITTPTVPRKPVFAILAPETLFSVP